MGNHRLIGLVAALVFTGGSAMAELSASIAPNRIQEGQIALLRVAVPPADLTIKVPSQEPTLFDCHRGSEPGRCAIIVAPLDEKVGKWEVELSWTAEGPKKQLVSFEVRKGKFQTNKLRVDPALTNPSEADRERIRQEKEEIEKAYASPEPAALWRGKFVLPIKSGITSRFGSRRTFNGEVRNTHYGADLRARTGTPIRCVNDGKVILAKPFFYAGNMVAIDHGLQVFTSYGHMSVMNVQLGQRVKHGERLGLSGSTGRSTGPHLHWAMRVNGHSVDPHQALKVLSVIGLPRKIGTD